MIAVDGDTPMAPGLVNVVLPENSRAKRVVALSRNLNGGGMGPFVAASKVCVVC